MAVMLTRPRASLAVALMSAIVLGGSMPALADTIDGTVGRYDMRDAGPAPAVLCAYPNEADARLDRFRLRGPRVWFPETVGEVGWVDWRAVVQRKGSSGPWRSIERAERLREAVDIYSAPERFRDRTLRLDGPTGTGRLRVVARLAWIDQGGDRVGGVRHVMRHYGWVGYGPGGSDPIRFDDVDRRSNGSCASRWTPPSA